eukprot:7480507-Pyramimonas_sp.AAC.1
MKEEAKSGPMAAFKKVPAQGDQGGKAASADDSEDDSGDEDDSGLVPPVLQGRSPALAGILEGKYPNTQVRVCRCVRHGCLPESVSARVRPTDIAQREHTHSGHHSQKGRENIPIAGTSRRRGTRIYP